MVNSSLPDDTSVQPQATPIAKIPVYRAAKYQGGYFYTADRYEYDSALPANGYRQESEVFRVFGDASDVTPTPAAPARLSTDNITFADTVTNFAGGDLIIKEDPSTAAFSSTSYSDYTIKIGGVTCTTTGQGYVADGGAASGNAKEIGCVIPKLAGGVVHDITIKVGTNPEQSVGTLYYATWNQFALCNYMQDFGANATACKNSLPQGRSVMIQDTRGGADIGYGAGNYRVKKMPDGNVWMIDNLALDPSKGYADNEDALGEPLWESGIQKVTCDDYDSPSYCDDSLDNVPQWTDGAYVTGTGAYTNADHSYGYLYNWCAATADTSAGCADSLAEDGTPGKEGMTTSLAPTGWKLPTGNTTGQFANLDSEMTAAATNGNPVYNTDAKQNYQDINGTNKPNPYQGVYSGYYNVGLYGQGSNGLGTYWSSTAYSSSIAWYLNFYFQDLLPGNDGNYKLNGSALRAVL